MNLFVVEGPVILNILLMLLFIGMAAAQLWLAWRFRAVFQEETPAQLKEDAYPPALLVLSLKGGDQRLMQCLDRLSSQDYPNYRLRLVIDSPEDPAARYVEEFLETSPSIPVEVCYLGTRRSTCSGKISGMLRGTEDLEGIEMVAFVDGDAQIEPFCLRRLAEGLQDDKVGIVTGNRWYVPSTPQLGTFCCYFWNLLAIPMMNVVQIPWGGCIGVRAEDLRPGPLRTRLENAFGEDSTIATFIRERGQHVQFLPDLLVLNHDDCGMRQLYQFVVRQYLTVRLHNPRWKFVVLYNLVMGLLFSAGLLAFVSSGSTAQVGRWGVSLLLISTVLLTIITQNQVRQRVRKISGQSIFWVTPARFLSFLVAIGLMNFLNLFATIHSLFVRQHIWRGLVYRFGTNPRVLIVAEKPLI